MFRSAGFEGHFGFMTPCVSFSLRGVERALLIQVGKSWCNSRDYRSRLRSCVHFRPSYLVGYFCHSLGRCSGPTIQAETLLLILPYEALVPLAQRFADRAQYSMPHPPM